MRSLGSLDPAEALRQQWPTLCLQLGLQRPGGFRSQDVAVRLGARGEPVVTVLDAEAEMVAISLADGACWVPALDNDDDLSQALAQIDPRTDRWSLDLVAGMALLSTRPRTALAYLFAKAGLVK